MLVNSMSELISRYTRGLRKSDLFRGFAGNVAAIAEMPIWRVNSVVSHYRGDIDEYRVRYGVQEGESRFFADYKPFNVVTAGGNLLMYGGASVLWESLIGNGTTTASAALTYFSNTNAAIGVGDSTTVEAATQTDLQGTSNKVRVACDATYPQHTDGTTSAANTITFKSTFGSGVANFTWNEWGVFNSPTAATGRMINRKVQSLGTKASGTSASFSTTISLS